MRWSSVIEMTEGRSLSLLGGCVLRLNTGDLEGAERLGGFSFINALRLGQIPTRTNIG